MPIRWATPESRFPDEGIETSADRLAYFRGLSPPESRFPDEGIETVQELPPSSCAGLGPTPESRFPDEGIETTTSGTCQT